MKRSLSKLFVFLLKTTIIVGLFVYLATRALQGSVFDELDFRTVSYPLLLLGLVSNFVATTITILRWRSLVRALGSELSVFNAVKLGFIGFMFNLSPVGVVGGDAIRIVMLVRRHNIPLENATASGIVDRVVGLVAMFILGLFVCVITGFYRAPSQEAQFVVKGLIFLTLASFVFLALFTTSSRILHFFASLAEKIPIVGNASRKIIFAVATYREKKRALATSLLSSLTAHSFFAISLYCAAKGLFHDVPSLVNHFILYCAGNVGSIIPLSAGPFEYFLDELYPLFPIVGREAFDKGYGATIGSAYRLITVVVAFVGVISYLFERRTIRATLHADDLE